MITFLSGVETSGKIAIAGLINCNNLKPDPAIIFGFVYFNLIVLKKYF